MWYLFGQIYELSPCGLSVAEMIITLDYRNNFNWTLNYLGHYLLLTYNLSLHPWWWLHIVLIDRHMHQVSQQCCLTDTGHSSVTSRTRLVISWVPGY